MLTNFTPFVIVPAGNTPPSRSYRAIITCTACDWSGEAELMANQI